MIDVHYAKIMNLPSPNYKSASLRSYYDTTEKHLRCLQSLGENINQMQILSMLKSKLPRSVLTELEKMKPIGEEWTVKKFRELLNQHITIHESCDIQTKIFHKEYEPKPLFKSPQPRRPNGLHSTGEGLMVNERLESKFNKKCIFCDKGHWSDECLTYPDIQSRRQKLANRCLICLKEGHRMKECKKVEKTCVHCREKRKHHRSLCPAKFPAKKVSGGQPSSMMMTNDTNSQITEEVIEPPVAPVNETTMLSMGEHVVMQTALVEALPTDESKSEVTRILMDTGSSRTYITEDIVNRLGLKPLENDKLSVYTFGLSKPKEIVSPIVSLTLKSKYGNTIDIRANVVPKISGNIQRVPIPLKDRFSLHKKFKLADTLPQQVESFTLGILIGSDYYNEIVKSEKVEIQKGLYIINSKFGWIMTGRTKLAEGTGKESSLFVMTHSNSRILPESQYFSKIDDTMPSQPNVEDLWKLETIGITPPDKTDDSDRAALDHFKNTVKRVDNRYQVAWPWRDENQILPDNYELSIGRLNSLVKRLKQDPELMSKYNDIIQDQLKKGMIEVVTKDTEKGNKHHYIPHHAVLKPDSNTTKVRVVYDASARTKKSNPSLNECLHRGPVILEDICGLLMRFRTKKIAMVADIEKAFLQIELQPKERDVTRFLWLKDMNSPVTPNNIQIFRFTRVPFGITSSPFLLGATINHHLEQDGSTIMKDIYVDNILTGAETQEQAIELYKTTKEKFKEISMNVREWKSNDNKVNDVFREDEAKGSQIKVLGLQWTTNTDQMSIKIPNQNKGESAISKRQVLAHIASIFDPLGYLLPTTMKMRLFLKQLWNDNKDWDDIMTEEQCQVWKQLIQDTNELPSVEFSRYIGSKDSQLFCFSDASKDAYAAAIYLKTTIDGKPHVNLIFAKSRVSPKKSITIPRLELLALLIGVRSLKFVTKELGLENTQRTIWSDSQCVLHWLKSKKPLSVFVKNRVKEIRKEENLEFRYINTKENPSDIPTRGLSSLELKDSLLWWKGPQWLEKDPKDWPTWNVEKIDKEVLEAIQSEEKVLYEATMVSEATKAENIPTPFGISGNRFSSFTKLLRVTAYVNRFIMKLKKVNNLNGPITAEEMDAAKVKWIKYLQRKHFLEIKQGNVTLKKDIVNNQLNPKMDKDGIIRCYGRLVHADLPEETINPILLPKRERFVQLLIENLHKGMLHVGVNHTLSELRKLYWIQKGRAEVKYILNRCRTCRKYQGGPFKMPEMSPWPKDKTTRAVPFQKTGLDYFGPLYINENGEKKKVWVCLFTCVVVRAVHLEMVADLTAEEFLMGLRRFIARRGTPEQIISDNATQFKLSKSTIDLAWERMIKDENVQSYVAEQGIKWKFIIELSPWIGGFYERLVGSSKMALKKSVGKKYLSILQLQTLLTEVEAVINTRPLVYVGEELNNGVAITPSHFLSTNWKTGTPIIENEDEQNDPNFEPNDPTSAEALLNTWKKGQRILETFWKMWKDDYLLSLRERSQRNLRSPRIESNNTPKIGDVVQLKDDTPRGSWRLGKIMELITSQDGEIRAAKVLLTTKNIVNRPLNLLYPLECSIDEKTVDKSNTEKDQGHQTTQDAPTDITPQPEPTRQRLTRKAAFNARDKILAQSFKEHED